MRWNTLIPQTEENAPSMDSELDVSQAFDLLKEKPTEESPKHGDVVVGEDGIGELVVDRRHEINKVLQDKRISSLIKLKDTSDPLFDSIRSKPRTEPDDDPGLQLIKKDPNSEQALKLSAVKRDFAGLTFGPMGLVPVGSEDAKKFALAMQLVRDGKVKLPTVEEYDRQKELGQKQTQEDQNMADLKVTGNRPERPTRPESPKVLPLEKNNQEPIDPAKVKQVTPIGRNQEEPTIPEKKDEPLSMDKVASLLREKKGESEEVNQPEQKEVQTKSEETSITFNVEKDQTDTFIGTLPDVDKKVIHKTRDYIINEVVEVDIPTATRTIDDIDIYHRIVPRENVGEYVEVVLPNSGYIATVGGCTAVEMSSILPDMQTGDIDYGKRFQFCFKCLKTTSVGTLSYQEFLRYTALNDLNALVWAIYRASVPTENAVTLTCGNQTCKTNYEIKFNTNKMCDEKALSPETIEQINKITYNRDDFDESDKLRKHAPASTIKYVKVGNRVWAVSAPNGAIAIERSSKLASIIEKYPYSLLGIMLIYIPEMYMDVEISGKMETFRVDSPEVIAEELTKLPDSEYSQLAKVINTLVEYDPYTYRLEGQFRCPKCGRVEKNGIPINIDDLVFQKVTKSMSFE